MFAGGTGHRLVGPLAHKTLLHCAAMARRRNYDTAASPGHRYQGEPEVVHGRRPIPPRTPKLRQSVRDTRSRLPYSPPAVNKEDS